MRIALSIAAVLGLLATLWCAAGYFTAPAQALETQEELRVFLDRPVSADVPVTHSSRVLLQGRNVGIAALLTGSSTALMFTALALSFRRKSHEHTRA
jgi:hypothetical protein